MAARDGGCCFYGCDAPVDWCDVHHLTHRAAGGRHHPDELALLCRGDHRVVHEHGWQLTRDPATGVLTGRRGHRVWRTQPRGSPLAPAPARPPPTPSDPPAAPGDQPPDGDLPF